MIISPGIAGQQGRLAVSLAAVLSEELRGVAGGTATRHSCQKDDAETLISIVSPELKRVFFGSDCGERGASAQRRKRGRGVIMQRV